MSKFITFAAYIVVEIFHGSCSVCAENNGQASHWKKKFRNARLGEEVLKRSEMREITRPNE